MTFRNVGLKFIYYERLNRRRFYVLKGLINLYPNLSLFIFLIAVRNIAAPPEQEPNRGAHKH